MKQNNIPKNGKLRVAVLKTLHYSDIFDYPLTAEEIHKYLIRKKADFSQVCSALKTLESAGSVVKEAGFYCLPGREELINRRGVAQKISVKKLAVALSAVRILRLIPWVKGVFVTGRVAVGNSYEKDDVDFLVIAGTKRTWITRGLATLALDLFGKRRRPHGAVKDKVCLNMFLSLDSLEVPWNEQNIYTSHEVAQVRPIFERESTYLRFVQGNEWVKVHLPNWWEMENKKSNIEKTRSKISISRRVGMQKYSSKLKIFEFLSVVFHFSVFIFNLAESLSYKLQLRYMNPRITEETLEPDRILFHPKDVSFFVLEEFESRTERL